MIGGLNRKITRAWKMPNIYLFILSSFPQTNLELTFFSCSYLSLFYDYRVLYCHVSNCSLATLELGLSRLHHVITIWHIIIFYKMLGKVHHIITQFVLVKNEKKKPLAYSTKIDILILCYIFYSFICFPC